VSSLVFGNGGAGHGSILGYTLTLAGGLVYAMAALGNDRNPSKK
jgi:drug/metabolite transporter (DMT)-like permease